MEVCLWWEEEEDLMWRLKLKTNCETEELLSIVLSLYTQLCPKFKLVKHLNRRVIVNCVHCIFCILTYSYKKDLLWPHSLSKPSDLSLTLITTFRRFHPFCHILSYFAFYFSFSSLFWQRRLISVPAKSVFMKFSKERIQKNLFF